jgi:hypothetical protein
MKKRKSKLDVGRGERRGKGEGVVGPRVALHGKVIGL